MRVRVRARARKMRRLHLLEDELTPKDTRKSKHCLALPRLLHHDSWVVFRLGRERAISVAMLGPPSI